MAKQNPINPQRSKIRLFYVDADLAPGDLQELTNALTSAIRPTHTITTPSTPARIAAPRADTNGDHAELHEVEVSEVVDDVHEEEGPTTNGKRVRRPRSVQVLHDIDWTGGGAKSWAEFAKEIKPSTELDKFIVAAYWLDANAKLSSVGADHIYSCYKAAGWTWEHVDATAPFRALKKAGCGKLQRGTFTIEVLGRTRVEKLMQKSSSGDS